MIAALGGGASSSLSMIITAEMLFISIAKYMKLYLCESVYQFDLKHNGDNHEVKHMSESIRSSVDREVENEHHKIDFKNVEFNQIEDQDDCSQLSFINEDCTGGLYNENSKRNMTTETIILNQDPIMVVPKIPRSGIISRIFGSDHIGQSSSACAMNIVVFRCSPPPAPTKPEVSL